MGLIGHGMQKTIHAGGREGLCLLEHAPTRGDFVGREGFCLLEHALKVNGGG